ncbi:M16 family metallopeptidase [Amycolatopsis nigrescens]|uniref:M16 family metallopeptidase n=1 Tax=Amycolatopsis nigrescens TaxID=381445 RepID=UPI00036BC7EC|nr:insulinase family protein [Amycolatopsis nigrescens]
MTLTEAGDASYTLPEVNRTEVDGVPVFWNHRPGRLKASLIFGVGQAGEGFLDYGITHLVEHLVMRAVSTERYENNAATGVLNTSFEVASNPGTVIDHLARLCAALTDLDTGSLDLERGVVTAEERDNGGPSIVEWLPSTLWFGNQAYGLLGNIQLAPVTADADRVRAWAARWFHRGNAALVLSGPPPHGLRLPLPDGPRGTPPRVTPFELLTPAWTAVPNGVLGCALVRWGPAMACALNVLENRLTEQLRHRDGLVYQVVSDFQLVGPELAVAGFGTDLPDADAGRAAEVIQSVLADLGRTGPTADELADDRASLAEGLEEPEFAEYTAVDAAMAELTGWPSVTEHQLSVLRGLRAEDVAAAASELAGNLVLCTPGERPPAGLTELSGFPVPPVTGKPVKRSLFGSSVPKGYRLVSGPEGLTSYSSESDIPVAVVRFDDLAGVGLETEEHADEPILHLYTTHGGSIALRAADWRGGRALVREVRQRIEPALCFRTPEPMRLIEPAGSGNDRP